VDTYFTWSDGEREVGKVFGVHVWERNGGMVVDEVWRWCRDDVSLHFGEVDILHG
jgi:hypothetical protein